MEDFNTVTAAFAESFGDLTPSRKKLPGVNMMSPDVLGTFAVPGHLVEVSTGTDFSGSRIFGLTARSVGDLHAPGPGVLVQGASSMAEVRARFDEFVNSFRD